MACARIGKPSYFVTMTTNPFWSEIVESLLPGQKAADRPEIVARVFKQKLDALVHEIEHRGMCIGCIDA